MRETSTVHIHDDSPGSHRRLRYGETKVVRCTSRTSADMDPSLSVVLTSDFGPDVHGHALRGAVGGRIYLFRGISRHESSSLAITPGLDETIIL